MQNPYQHPSSGPTAWAPPPGHGAANNGDPPNYGYDPRSAEMARLAEETRTWTIVAAIGWFVGFMWVLGPLAWYQAARIGDAYAALGVAPPQEQRTLRLIGMITTVLSVVFAVFGVVVVAMYAGFFLMAARR